MITLGEPVKSIFRLLKLFLSTYVMFQYACYILLVIYHVQLTGASGEQKSFDLKVGESKKIFILQNSKNIFRVNDISSDIILLLFEVHSQKRNITLSRKEDVVTDCSITGKNIGLSYKLKLWESEAHMWVFNQERENFTILTHISPLDFYGPIPGGCNMEFPTEIAPYLRLINNHGKSVLEFQHSSVSSFRDEPFPLCSLTLPYITYDIYVLHLKENDFSEREFFDKLSIMSNSSSMKQTATQVKHYEIHPDTRFSFLMYPNVGVIYNVIAKYTINGVVKEACYVPITSYGCGKAEFTEFGCNFSFMFEGKTFLFLLSMYGFITSYFGHKFFTSTVFFFGFLSAFFVTFILFGRFSNFSKAGILNIAILMGVIIGGLWLALWLWLQSSLISVLLIGLVLGFLISATVLYTPIGNYEINMNNKNYWLLLSTGSLLVTVLFLAYPTVLSILGSSIVGSYVMLLFYDDFIGTRLSFIILNVIKRAVSEKLDFATNDFPFEIKDILICTAWIILSIFAVIIQSRSLCLCTYDIRGFFNKLFCCKSNQPTIMLNSNGLYNSPQCSERQPLLSKSDSVFYRTFYE